MYHINMQSLVQLLRRIDRRDYILPVVLCVFALLCNLHQPLLYVHPGLDPSFNYGIGQAALLGKSFGTDFIATYGPLGYLIIDYLPNFVVQASLMLVVFALALGIGSYIFVRRWGPENLVMRLGLGMLMVYVFSLSYGLEWNLLAVFLLYSFLYAYGTHKNKVILAVLSAVAATFLYIKLTLGLAALGTVVLLPLSNISFDRKTWKQAAQTEVFAAVPYVVVAIAWSWLLHVTNLVMYARTSWDMSAGFSEAMSYQLPGTELATVFCALAILTLTAMCAVAFSKIRLELNRAIFLAPALYVIWKYAVVRQDGHILRLVQIILPLTLLIVIYRLHKPKTWMMLATAGLACAALVFTIGAIPLNQEQLAQDFLPVLKLPFENIQNGSFARFFAIGGEEQTWRQVSNAQLTPDKLPERFRQRIGASGVDVFPWESAVIAANSLRWQNRPAPYSFETYRPLFDDLNAGFFMSSRAPKYIVWHNEGGVYGIDARNVVWDEPKTLRAILSNYTDVDMDAQFILLEKKHSPVIAHEQQLGRQTASWGDWLEVPANKASESGLTFVTAAYPESKRLAVEEFLVRSENISISVEYADGTVATYRAVSKMLPQGYLASDVPSTWQELNQLLSGNYQNTVRRIRFNAGPGYVSHTGKLEVSWFTDEM